MFLRRGGTRVKVSFPSRLILITGGARAGKSQFAQSLAEAGAYQRRLFLATAVACDAEMESRIARHRRSRNGLCAEARGPRRFASRNEAAGGRWKTVEEPIRLPERIPAQFLRNGSLLLLDCLPTFVTNLLLSKGSEKQIEARVRRLLRACRRPGVTTLMISNEVGLGLVPENSLGRRFRDLLGTVNQQVARSSDEVYLLVAGIPMRVK